MTNSNDIEQLFKAHYVQMYRLTVALLYDGNLARDIVHDVFVSLVAPILQVRPVFIAQRGLEQNTLEQINIKQNGNILTID